jgi:hypothetical protein
MVGIFVVVGGGILGFFKDLEFVGFFFFRFWIFLDFFGQGGDTAILSYNHQGAIFI